MKGMKGKLLKKLKSIRPISYLIQDHVLQVKASDGYVQSLTKNSTFTPHTQNFPPEKETNNKMVVLQSGMKVQEHPEIIDVSDLMRDLQDPEHDFNNDDHDNNKENITSRTPRLSEPRDYSHGATPLSEIEVSSFRRPELNSGSLFDPNIPSALEKAVKEQVRMTEAEKRARRIEESCDENEMNEEEPPLKTRCIEEDIINPLVFFEEKCPPWGSDSVIFYTTTLGGIRKTFEDCNNIRFLLESFGVLFFERDISMHKEFKEELFSTLDGKTVLPRLFVKGRYIGGAEEVLSLHEQGKLRSLLEGMPIDRSNGPCEACGGIRFVLCFKCNGSHKVIAENGQTNQCPNCNENGLIICPHCC